LPEGCCESVVSDDIPDLLELFPNLLPCLCTPGLILRLLPLDLHKFSIVFLDILLILLFEFCDELDRLLMRLRNGLDFFVDPLEAEQGLLDFFIMQFVKIISLNLFIGEFGSIILHEIALLALETVVVVLDLDSVMENGLF
jgi:hypothetical protein